MFGHHVRSYCEIGRTFSKFGRTMSDDRLLFPALTGVTYRRTRSQLKPDTTAVSDSQREWMETPVYQGQQATSPTPIRLTQTSQKDSITAGPGSDNTALTKQRSRKDLRHG